MPHGGGGGPGRDGPGVAGGGPYFSLTHGLWVALVAGSFDTPWPHRVRAAIPLVRPGGGRKPGRTRSVHAKRARQERVRRPGPIPGRPRLGMDGRRAGACDPHDPASVPERGTSGQTSLAPPSSSSRAGGPPQGRLGSSLHRCVGFSDAYFAAGVDVVDVVDVLALPFWWVCGCVCVCGLATLLCPAGRALGP